MAAIVVVLVLFVSAGLAAQVGGIAPARDASAARVDLVRIPIGTASVTGVATEGSTGRPVADAVVQLLGLAIAGEGANRSTMPFERIAVTAADGTFAIERLPAGRFRLVVSRRGFLSATHGAVRPGGRGTAITVTEGRRVPVSVRLVRPGAIAGRAVDEKGDPLTHGYVRASRIEWSDGRHRLIGHHQVPVDDEGSYRLFGLQPGRYLVAVVPAAVSDAAALAPALAVEAGIRTAKPASAGTPPGSSIPTVVISRPRPAATHGHHVSSLPTFHPSTTEADQATVIRISGGDVITGLDIVGRFERPGTIRGSVLPLPAEGVSIRVVAIREGRAIEDTWRASATVDKVGRFTIGGLAPGWYVLLAEPMAGPRPLDDGLLWGRGQVLVDAGSESTVALTLEAGRTVSGVVQFEGIEPPAPDAEVTVALMQAPRPLWEGAFRRPVARINAQGRFTIGGVAPGRYYFQTSLGWLREAVVHERDVQDAGLEVTADRDIAGVRLVAAGRRSTLSGHLTDADGDDAVDVAVLVAAADSRYWTAESRRIALRWPDLLGRYTAANLPAGEYFVAVVRDPEPGTERDPEFLRRASEQAVRVRLVEGTDAVLNLRVGR